MAWVVCLLSTVIGVRAVGAQEPISTPLQVQIPDSPPAQNVPDAPGQPAITPTWTPTAPPPVLLEAFEVANVRSLPDQTADRLGEIRAGESYPVTGRYFEWYQFQYDPSPTDRGWVFGQLVQVTGDVSLIPEVDLSTQSTLLPAEAGATATLEILTLTPGGLLTATAAANSAVQQVGEGTPTAQVILPTFTYPPDVQANAPTTAADDDGLVLTITQSEVSDDALPPILPIVALGGAGLLGLMVSALFRRR
ncbi:MAG: SH3 domain-containing protein [Blastochloris sp.]|nr:SH3 domain-containing protein [Blastochloris sp.]